MKKIILILMLALAALTGSQTIKAQITLIQTYDSATTNLYIVNLEIEGQKYIYRDLFFNHRIILYNLDHSIFKIMPFPNVSWGTNPNAVLYVSEHLFNLDDSIEYMLAYTTPYWHTLIVNEAGSILFSGDSLGAEILVNTPQTQVPIYNTPNGTIMILSNEFGAGVANVYSLTGTLTNSIGPINFGSGNQVSLENIFPNPSNGNTTIEFNLPQGVNTGQLVIYNNQGVELKRYAVDNAFHTLLLNNSEFHAGTYFYQLVTAGGVSGAKKMIVIH